MTKVDCDIAGLRQVEYVISKKGATHVLLDGYLYAMNKAKGETVYWRCVKRSCSDKCTCQYPVEETTQMQLVYIILIDASDDKKILPFSSDEALEALLSRDKIYMDGTFSSCLPVKPSVHPCNARIDLVSSPFHPPS